MKNQRAVQGAAIGLLLVAALPLVAQDKRASAATGSGDSIGFIASKNPDAKEVGLPLYPGARPHLDKSGDSPKLQLGLWGGAWGFKLVVLKLETNDPPEEVTSLYRKALAKYGRVLNCSESAQMAGAHEKSDTPKDLDCEDEQPESGVTILKAGTKEKQHIVAIKAEGGLSVFQLVYVELPPSDSKK